MQDAIILIVLSILRENAYKIEERLIKNCSRIKFKKIPTNVLVGIAIKEKASDIEIIGIEKLYLPNQPIFLFKYTY